nr:SDR family NAD(P)-dependent oxidoreductase [uncultured Massilia sp.]
MNATSTASTMGTTGRPLALVTGASSGIGYELAKLFAADGHDVVITATQRAGLERTAAELRAAGAEAIVVEADLTDFAGVEALYAAVQATGRPLAAAALNAGVGLGGYFVGGTDLQRELSMIQLNAVSQVHLTKRLLPDMVARGSGRLLYTASISGTMPTPYETVYGATKAFLISFAEAVKSEIKDSGVSITLLMPGQVDTNFWPRAGMVDNKLGVGEKAKPDEVAKEGYDAMKEGKDRIVAGMMSSKFIGNVVNNVAPDTVKADLHAGQARPGSGVKH